MFQKIKEEPTIFLFRKMWQFSQGNHFKIVLFIVLSIISCSISLFEPIILGKLLNEIQKNGINGENLKFLLFLASFSAWFVLISWFFHGIARILERKNSFLVRKNYKEYLIKGVLNLDLSWHTDKDSGDTIDKINKSSSALYSFSDGIFQIVNIIVQFLGTAIALIYFSWKVGIFILLGALITFFISNKFNKKLVKQYKELNNFENKVEAKIFDSVSNITSIIILNIKQSVFKNISKSIEEPFSLYKRNMYLNETKWFLTDFSFRTFMIALPLTFYIYNLYQNSLSVEIGTITALYAYLRGLGMVFFSFNWIYEAIIKNKSAVLNAEEIEKSFAENKQIERKSIKNWQKIDISNLFFSYQNEDNKIHLKDINFSLKSGERVALIGESGSGKTTFLKVFHGLYENSSAKIKVDKNEEFKTNFADLDLKTMLVPQEPELFSSSVRENITFGLDCSDKEIKKWTDLAQFSDVVENLPKKFDSIINEKGINLSGGQKQRLALSRALLFSQDKEVILLDESTSSVDPENEVKIYKNIFNYFKNKTILASIHKINLLKYFDRIVIFQEGKIVDLGTFDELLERNEKFKKDWEIYVSKESGFSKI